MTYKEWLKQWHPAMLEEWEQYKREERKRQARESARKIYQAGRKALKKDKV